MKKLCVVIALVSLVGCVAGLMYEARRAERETLVQQMCNLEGCIYTDLREFGDGNISYFLTIWPDGRVRILGTLTNSDTGESGFTGSGGLLFNPGLVRQTVNSGQ